MTAKAVAERRRKAKIEQRLSKAVDPQLPEGVQPLNPGFFKMQRLRAGKGPKCRN